MYQVKMLPLAKKDLFDIEHYIKDFLHNPTAARNLVYDLMATKNRLAEFPFAYPLCRDLQALKHEYRKVPVRNYLLFYWVDETNQTVTIARVIYARRNYKRLLKGIAKDKTK